MAQVQLGRYEAEEGELPPQCLRCGAPATVFRAKRFSWHPKWVYLLALAGLLPFIVVALFLSKRMQIQVPLCAVHRFHWLKRLLIALIGPLLLLTLLLTGIFAVVFEMTDRERGFSFLTFCSLGLFVALLAWIVAAMILQVTGIRPKEITEYSITLTGVAAEFTEALRGEKERSRRKF